MRFSVVCVLGAVVFGGCVQANDPPPSEPAPAACPNAELGCATQPDDFVITTATATDNVVWPTGPTGFTDDGSWTIQVADNARRPGKSER